MPMTMSMAALVTVAPISVLAVALPISLAIFPSPTFFIALAFVIRIVALIFRIVFLRSHEVHGPIAGVVFTAVLAPISCMPRRHVEIDGRRRSFHRLPQQSL